MDNENSIDENYSELKKMFSLTFRKTISFSLTFRKTISGYGRVYQPY